MQESIPRITGTLRAHTIEMPEVIREASGIIVLGRKNSIFNFLHGYCHYSKL